MNDQIPASRHGPPWWAILLIALAAGAGAWLGQSYWQATPNASSALLHGDGSLIRYPVPKPVPAVELTDRHARPWTPEALRGRYTLAFFGFTHCPDICPTALGLLKAAAERWRSQLPADQQPQVLFVSIDPKRDTPAQLGQYVDFFDPSFLAVTGPDEALLPWTRSLGIVYVLTPNGPGEFDYSVDHSGSILLIDPQLQLVGLYRPPHTVEALVSSVLAQLGGKSP